MDYVSIPTDILRLHKNVDLDIDVLYVNKIPLLVSQAKNIMFASLEHIVDHIKKVPFNSIRHIINLNSKHGFVICSIAMDGEFECLITDMAGIGVTSNPIAKGDFVPGIERQTIVTMEQSKCL
eukprot:562199-Ditylum_brightwellii.AAC.1